MPEDPSLDFGGFLRQARERQGITLRQIADSTKISLLSLEALERNDISRLPGGLFSRSFVRAYAREAGLDPEDAVRHFVARFPEVSMDESPAPYDPNPERIAVDEQPSIGRGWRAVGWVLPLLLVIAYFGFGGRLPFWRASRTLSAPAPAQETAVPPSPLVARAPEVPLPAEHPAEPPVEQAVGQAAQPAAPPDAAAAVRRPDAASAGSPGAEAPPADVLRLTLAPQRECWVSVRAGGESVFSGLMRAGERRTLDVKGEVMLTVGDAGGFAFAINGEAGRTLGNAGEVKTIRFGPASYRDLLEVR